MKKINILLTKYSDLFSNLIVNMNGKGYTHVSISLEGNESVYYSFNYRGFCIETIEKHKRHNVTKFQNYSLAISDDSYEKVQSIIEHFKKNRHLYHYTRLGVIFCLLHIPFKWERHYFCSQFVVELLVKSNAVDFRKAPELYLPNHIYKELEKI